MSRDPYVWFEPEDGTFLGSMKEALAMERNAWGSCDAERRLLARKVRWFEKKMKRIEELLDAYEGGKSG